MKQPKKTEELPPWAGGTLFDLIDARLDLSPQAYVLRFAVKDDWDAMRDSIEERRRALPAFAWFGCPVGHCLKVRGDTISQVCHTCGQAMAPLSMEKAAEAQAVADAQAKAESEQSFRAALFARNQQRRAAGLEPLTEDQLRAELRR